MKAEIVRAEAWHAEAIAANPRPADVAELWATSRSTPLEVMQRGMKATVNCYTGLYEGAPVCMFGASPFSILGGMGSAWMVGSAALDRMCVQKALLTHSRAAAAFMAEQFPGLLYNFVDQRNEAAIRWLRWLGFTFSDPIPYGVDGLPFLPFYLRGAP